MTRSRPATLDSRLVETGGYGAAMVLLPATLVGVGFLGSGPIADAIGLAIAIATLIVVPPRPPPRDARRWWSPRQPAASPCSRSPSSSRSSIGAPACRSWSRRSRAASPISCTSASPRSPRPGSAISPWRTPGGACCRRSRQSSGSSTWWSSWAPSSDRGGSCPVETMGPPGRRKTNRARPRIPRTEPRRPEPRGSSRRRSPRSRRGSGARASRCPPAAARRRGAPLPGP